MSERTPLSGREYGALQSLFAVVSSWEVGLPVLAKRAEAAGCSEEAKQMQTLSGKVLDALLKTVPQKKLAHIREELAHVAVYVKVEAPGIKTNHRPNYAYLPVETLNELLNHMIREGCVLCEADPDTAKKCKYRKLIESALPHSVGTDQRSLYVFGHDHRTGGGRMIATDDAKVGDFIFERRTALGMTQRQLAEAAHYNHVCVSRIETGTMVPRLDTLIDLCKVLGLEIEIREKQL